MRFARWLPKPEPWLPPDHDEEVVMAVRALWACNANAGQQETLRRYLMYLTKADEEFADLPFRPENRGGQRATDFALGMLFVGQQLRKLLRPEYTPNHTPPVATLPVAERLRAKRRAKVGA